MTNLKRNSLAAALVVSVYILVEAAWIAHHALLPTLCIVVAAALALGALYRRPAGAAGAGAPASGPGPGPAGSQDAARPPRNWLFSLLLGAVGLMAAFWAFQACFQEHWLQACAALLLGALAWRLRLPERLPGLSPRLAAAILLSALLVGGAFRFYRAGDIPLGLCTVDEQKLIEKARSYLHGERETFASGVITGAVPYYLEALGMRFFGEDLKGFRMSGVITGTFLVLVFFLLGRDIGGTWVGLAAAFLWAMSVWPVTISRAHYIIIESDLFDLTTMVLLVQALKRRSALLFALAGLCWSGSFNVYTASQIMAALVPWLLFLVWFLKPSWRGSLAAGIPPLLAGFLVGMAPLALWLWADRPGSIQEYTLPLNMPVMVGNLSEAALHSSLWTRGTGLLGRISASFPGVLRMIDQSNSASNSYFPKDFPLIHPLVFYFFLAGVSVCLARFRNALIAFLPYWWFVGLFPSLTAAGGGASPDSRRVMESLAPLLLIAALGLIAALDVLGRAVSARARKPLALAGAALILAWLGVASWHDYFERNQKSYDLLSLTRANAVECLRAVHDENLKGPVVVITTRQLAFDSWQMPSPDPWRGQEFEALNPDVVWMVNGSSPDYCRKKGFFGSLDWALDQAGALKQRDGKDRDVLVVLDPFYFYLEPLLHSLGGRTVRELPVLQSTEGPVLGDIGQAPTRDFIAKLVRLHGLQTRDMDALRDRLFRFRLGEMKPPGRMGRQAAAALVPASPGYRALLEGWEAHPERWSVSRTAEVDVPDPWSWDSVLQFYDAPMLLRSSFDLLIPVDGLYSFGASATPITLLRVDRKRVFFRDPAEPAQGGASSDPSPPFPPERVGYLGKAVYLKAGAHRLDLDQLLVNPTANYALRLIWRKPGGLLETLPLEVLRPAPL